MHARTCMDMQSGNCPHPWSIFPIYIHTYECYACVCACAHLHTCAFTVVKTWINGRPSSRAAQRSDAAHFSTLCCQMPPSHTHTRTYSCAACRTGCSRNVTQKKKQRCQRHRLQPRPRRSALLSLSSTLILSLPHSFALFSFVHCIS